MLALNRAYNEIRDLMELISVVFLVNCKFDLDPDRLLKDL